MLLSSRQRCAQRILAPHVFALVPCVVKLSMFICRHFAEVAEGQRSVLPEVPVLGGSSAHPVCQCRSG
eukprot:10512330-Alexandrium_andersonii.AAC.1